MFDKSKNSQNKEGHKHHKKDEQPMQGEKGGQPQTGESQKSPAQDNCEEYKNDLKRVAAEFDNYKKRTDKQMQTVRQLGREDVLIQLLTLSDEFASALKHSKSDANAKEGLSLLAKKIAATISSFEVEEIECKGDLNPNLHEVILTVPGKEKGKICQVLRKGYKIGDSLLRPAQVSVYSGEENGNGNTDSDDKEKKTDRPSGSKNGGENGDEN